MNDNEWKYLLAAQKTLGGEGAIPSEMRSSEFLKAIKSMTDGYIITAAIIAEQRANEISFWHRKAFKQKFIEAAKQKAFHVLAKAEAWLAIDIHKLAREGTPQAILSALNLGSDPNERDNKGWTPLMRAAAFNQNPDTIKILIQSGADIHARVEYEPMMLIHYEPDVSKEIILINRSNCWTPLMCASVFNNNPNILKKLIDFGANINARDNFGRSPPKNKEDNRISTGITVLMLAAHYTTNPEIITTLTNAGADILAQDDNGWTALMCAAQDNPNHMVIKALIKAGSEINARNIFGSTALKIAKTFNNKNREVITTLINFGAID